MDRPRRASAYEWTAHDLPLLDELAVPRPDGTRVIAERLTHAEIASRVGCSREMVSRLMKDLELGGYVVPGKSGLTLPQPLPRRW